MSQDHNVLGEIIFSNIIQETVQELLDKKDEMNNQEDMSNLLGIFVMIPEVKKQDQN